MYHPAESDKIVLKVGTPNKHITGMSCSTKSTVWEISHAWIKVNNGNPYLYLSEVTAKRTMQGFYSAGIPWIEGDEKP